MKKIAEGNNPHVVNMIGCVTLQEPLCLVTEFVKYGDLLSYLRTTRKQVRGGRCMHLSKEHLLLPIHYRISHAKHNIGTVYVYMHACTPTYPDACVCVHLYGMF